MTFDPNNPPKPLTLDAASGKVHGGGVAWGYANPFPVPNGTPGGGASKMRGVVMHTEVGYDHTVVEEFEDPHFQASAFFSVRVDGHIEQYGPIGKNWMAWAQVDGNPRWYSIEHEDKANPLNPLTDAQLTSSALLVEFLSRFAGFPLQVTNSPTGTGYGTHFMGGAAWGGHTCPDVSASHPVRSLQRAEIIRRAKIIRNGGPLGTVQAVKGGEWTRLHGTNAEIKLPDFMHANVRVRKAD